MDLGKPRRLDFATVRELCTYFDRNPTRASFCALGLLFPQRLELTAQQVDSRHRQLGNLHDLGGWLYQQGVQAGTDELQLAEIAQQLWDHLLPLAFPGQAEVTAEMGNS